MLFGAGHGDIEEALLVGNLGGAGIAENLENRSVRVSGGDDLGVGFKDDYHLRFQAFRTMHGEKADLAHEISFGHDGLAVKRESQSGGERIKRKAVDAGKIVAME